MYDRLPPLLFTRPRTFALRRRVLQPSRRDSAAKPFLRSQLSSRLLWHDWCLLQSGIYASGAARVFGQFRRSLFRHSFWGCAVSAEQRAAPFSLSITQLACFRLYDFPSLSWFVASRVCGANSDKQDLLASFVAETLSPVYVQPPLP